ILYTKGGTQEFPIPFALPVMFGITATADAQIAVTTEVTNVPTEVTYDRPIRPFVKHIVFVVDESVRGDVIGINQAGIENTPFLSKSNDRVINFGVAVAAANCSESSRTMIRFGLRPDDFGDSGLLGLRHPSIWTYARRAGYRTVLVDAFHTSDGIQSDPV